MFHHHRSHPIPTRRTRSRRLGAGAAVAIAASLLGAAGAHADPGDNGGPGNSGAARQCQKGGWADLAPAEAPTEAFANQDACVSYGANGGTLVAHVLDPSITVSFVPTGNPSYCTVVGTFDDFAPGDVAVSFSSREAGSVFSFPGAGQIVTIGADGTAVRSFASYVKSSASGRGDAYVRLSTADVSSEFTEVDC